LEISLSLGNQLDMISLDEVIANKGEESNLMSLWRLISLPNEQALGFLEAVHFEREHSYYFEIERFPQLNEIVRNVVQRIAVDSPIGRFYAWGMVTLGEQASFEGESFDVTETARELLKKITEQMLYPAYEIRYSYLGPRNWKDREKSRKKWKKPIREQVGTLTLENGSVAEVCLVIEKEGYVFSLNFGSDEDVIKFFHSKLFQKTKWHSGAE
jgi:hypothetical protein